jgi:hypothetical protein
MEDILKLLSVIKDGGWGIAALALYAAYLMWKRQNALTDKLLDVVVNSTAVLTALKTLIEQRKGQ